MTFTVLALVVLVGLLGPLLAAKAAWRVPVVIGELAGGLLIGHSGFALVNAHDTTFSLLAAIGFGLTMFVAGSHVPVRDVSVRPLLVRGLAGAGLVGVAAAILGTLLATLAGTGHAALYTVLIASSSAALILPIVGSWGTGAKSSVAQLTVQVAIADTVCIIALPLVVDPAEVVPAALGAAAIAVLGVVLYFVLRAADRSGIRRRLHHFSEKRQFALELRTNLLLLFGLAALAEFSHVSVMLAGFALGLVVGAIGEPRRLARQLFGITEGFFGPLFFVWLGASLDLSGLGTHPGMIVVGVALGVAALIAHLASRPVGLPWTLGLVSAGQLGVPIAAATLGLQEHVLRAGEDAAIVLGAVVTIAATAVAAGVAQRLRGGPSATRQAPRSSEVPRR
ncbi:MAG: sodium:proton antiporter [Frondihabitans sp.]|nr:sodium:proton antiporter [Frondihabitans sp.]